MISPLSSISFLMGQRGLNNAQGIIQQALERLSTGKQINRASDDPSGMIAADEFTQRVKVIERELASLEFEEARLGAKEGALSVISDMMTELEGLVVQAANRAGHSQKDREAMQQQVDSIIDAMDMLANTTVFRGEKLFDGLFSTQYGMTIRVEEDSFEDSENGHQSVRVTLGSLKSGGRLNLVDGDLESAQKLIERAVGGVSIARAAIGSRIKDDIQPTRNMLLAEMEQSVAARSAIEDADFAVEVSNLVRGQILQQASISALLISRQSPQAALKMLEPNLDIARQTT